MVHIFKPDPRSPLMLLDDTITLGERDLLRRWRTKAGLVDYRLAHATPGIPYEYLFAWDFQDHGPGGLALWEIGTSLQPPDAGSVAAAHGRKLPVVDPARGYAKRPLDQRQEGGC